MYKILYKNKYYIVSADSAAYGLAFFNFNDEKKLFIFHPSALDLCSINKGCLEWEQVPYMQVIDLVMPQIPRKVVDIFGIRKYDDV